jgi:hypothetical protein
LHVDPTAFEIYVADLQGAQLAVAQPSVHCGRPQGTILRVECRDQPAGFLWAGDPFAAAGAGRQAQLASRVNEQRLIAPSEEIEVSP